MSKINLSPEYESIATAEDSIEAGELLFRQTLRQSEQADRIATETESLRAIALAAQIRKDVFALMAYHQAFLSKQALVKSGEWGEIKQGLNIDLFVQKLQ